MKISIQESAVRPGTYRVVLHTGQRAAFEEFLRHVEESSTITRADALAAMCVVPGDEPGARPLEVRPTLRHQQSACALVFHGSDEAFDHGDAAMLPDRGVPWAT